MLSTYNSVFFCSGLSFLVWSLFRSPVVYRARIVDVACLQICVCHIYVCSYQNGGYNLAAFQRGCGRIQALDCGALAVIVFQYINMSRVAVVYRFVVGHCLVLRWFTALYV